MIERDSRALVGSAGLALGGQGVALAAGLGSTIITIRLLTRAEYGRFALFFMLLEIVSHFIQWPNLGVLRFGREELGQRDGMPGSFWARMLLFALCSLATAAVLFAVRVPVAHYLQMESPIHLLLLAYVVLNGFVLMARHVFQAVTSFRAYAFAVGGVKVLNLAAILALFVLLDIEVNPSRIIQVQIGSFAVMALASLILLPWRLLLPFETSAAMVRRMIRYSWPMLPAGISVLVINWIDFAVIKHFFDEDHVGRYAAAYQAVIVLVTLSMTLMSAVVPLLVSLVVERRRDTLLWYVDEALPQIAWLTGIACALLAVCCEAIPLVLGAPYEAAIVPCQVLMAGVAAYIFFQFHAGLIKALDRMPVFFLVMASAAALNTLFDLLLVPRIGIRGAAIATSCTYLLSGLIFLPVLAAQPLLKRPDSHRLRALFGLLPAWLMAGLALASDRLFPDQATVCRVLCGLALVAAGVLAARYTGVFTNRTRRMLSRARMPLFVRRAVGVLYCLLSAEPLQDDEPAP